MSLTSNIAEVWERVMKKHVTSFLEENKLINLHQHGFRSKHSCLSQLLCHYDNILSNLEKGGNSDSVYLDFSKAFNKVDHGILGHRLKSIGVSGSTLKWLESFVRDRTHCVKICNTLSFEENVISGVPQGTVLGPLLFLCLINNIDEDTVDNEVYVSLFADDTRATALVNNNEDVENLQHNLNKIYKWQKESNMLFNSDKFEVLRIGKNSYLSENTNYFSPDYELLIEEKNEVKDLGVMFDRTLNFKTHINKIISKVRNKISWVSRTFYSCDLKLMKQLWKIYILPDIDYCSTLWFSPDKGGLINELEKLQFFLKKMDGLLCLNYWERLKIRNLLSIQRRLEHYVLIYTWKCIENLVPNCGFETKF